MSNHWDMGQFNTTFSCPECAREGGEDVLIEGYDDWNLHCATVHGRTAPAVATKRIRMRCLIYNEHYLSLLAHISRLYETRGQFDRPFQCPECTRVGETEPPPWIDSRQAWIAHCASAHKDTSSGTSVQWQSIETRKTVEGSCTIQELLGEEQNGKIPYQNNTSKKRSREDEEDYRTRKDKRRKFGK